MDEELVIFKLFFYFYFIQAFSYKILQHFHGDVTNYIVGMNNAIAGECSGKTLLHYRYFFEVIGYSALLGGLKIIIIICYLFWNVIVTERKRFYFPINSIIIQEISLFILFMSLSKTKLACFSKNKKKNIHSPLFFCNGNAHVLLHLFHFRGFIPIQNSKRVTTIARGRQQE